MMSCSTSHEGGTSVPDGTATTPAPSTVEVTASAVTPIAAPATVGDAATEQAAAELEFPPVPSDAPAEVAAYFEGAGQPLTELLLVSQDLVAGEPGQAVCQERLAALGTGPSPEELAVLAISVPDTVLADAFKALPDAVNEYVTRCATNLADPQLEIARARTASIVDVIVVRAQQLA